MNEAEILIIGANGQLGTALSKQYPGARRVDIIDLDISDWPKVENFNWDGTKYILNAAAFTNVDLAETPEGRVTAWKANAGAIANLVRICLDRDMLLLHISTEYVFDGTKLLHDETEALSPLGVYAQSKAAGDCIVSVLDKHYIVRTSWVIGSGKNFVKAMLELGRKGISPTVVNDQIGRLTFTSELARAIDFLLTKNVEYGTYNVSNEGDVVSWAEVARSVFKEAGLNLNVNETTTAEYFVDKEGTAPRPLHSSLDLTKIHNLGFVSRNWREDLSEYIKQEAAK